jgi:hypothetical protein
MSIDVGVGVEKRKEGNLGGRPNSLRRKNGELEASVLWR